MTTLPVNFDFIKWGVAALAVQLLCIHRPLQVRVKQHDVRKTAFPQGSSRQAQQVGRTSAHQAHQLQQTHALLMTRTVQAAAKLVSSPTMPFGAFKKSSFSSAACRSMVR